MAADRSQYLSRALTAIAWASSAYVLVLLAGFYFHFFTVRRHHIESASFILIAALVAVVLSRRSAVESPVAPHATAASGRVIAILAVSGALLLYSPILDAGLFADDFVLLDAARQGRLTVWRELFRPATFIVWRTVAAFTDSPGPALHVLNIVLHGLNAMMVGALVRRLGLPQWSIAAAVLFLGFPAAVEAVAWPSGIQDVLMTSLVLAFLLVALGDRQDLVSSLAAAALLVAALLTKETAVCAPLLALCLAFAMTRTRQVRTSLIVSIAVIVCFVAIRTMVLPVPGAYRSIPDRYTVKELLVRPFQSLLVPMRESEIQLLPMIGFGLAAAFVVPLTASAARTSRRSPFFRAMLGATGFILASVAPVYVYFFVTTDLEGSRYLYLASAGWVLAFVVVLDTSTERHRAAVRAAATFVIICWFGATRAHVGLWVDAAASRDEIIRAAETRMLVQPCVQWAVYGVPEETRGVPTFVNGFPEAMRERVPARIRMEPAKPEPGECRLVWTGTTFEPN